MATKKQEDEAAQAAAATTAPADPAPAPALVSPSGAIAEPEILDAVDLTHESADANPREDTTSEQNNIDWNDPQRVDPNDEKFLGEGLDLSVYGKGAAD